MTIDEIKEGMKSRLIEIRTYFYTQRLNMKGNIINDTIKLLSELEPHLKTEKDLLLIELAEIVVKNSFLLDRNSKFLKELGSFEHDRLFELLQKIKEQK